MISSQYNNLRHVLGILLALMLVACGPQQQSTTPSTPSPTPIPAPVNDTTPPVINVVSPLNNTVVMGTVTIAANATDNVSLVGVQFQLDGTNFGSEILHTPYNIVWNTQKTGNGSYLVKAVARDTAGNTSSSQISITVTNADTQAPTMPTNLTAIPVAFSQISLIWSAATDNISVTSYNVYRDNGYIGTTSATTYIDTGLAASTTYSYTVAALDQAGNMSAQTSPSQVTTSAYSKSYSTNFDLTENPISEGGVWSHNGTDWAVVQSGDGIAYGTQTGTNNYDDSYATLSGFSADHTAIGVIHLASTIDTSCTHEIELHLRWSDSANLAQGYEINMSFDGSVQIVRWNGGLGSFNFLGSGSYTGVIDGAVFKASIIGNAITAYVNDQQVATATDTTFNTGNPGIGFFRRNCGSNADFGFTSFTATQ
jgi:chitodextrinase